MKRQDIINGHLAENYPLDYILKQEDIAWKHVRNGTRPEGTVSDMAANFYANAPQSAVERGIKERQLATIPDENGFTYLSRQFSGVCCNRAMKWIEEENLLHCEICDSISHRDP
jgi:hypothetical protein